MVKVNIDIIIELFMKAFIIMESNKEKEKFIILMEFRIVKYKEILIKIIILKK